MPYETRPVLVVVSLPTATVPAGVDEAEQLEFTTEFVERLLRRGFNDVEIVTHGETGFVERRK